MVFNVKLKKTPLAPHSDTSSNFSFDPVYLMLHHGTNIMCFLGGYKAKNKFCTCPRLIGNPSFWTLETLALHLTAGLVRGFLSFAKILFSKPAQLYSLSVSQILITYQLSLSIYHNITSYVFICHIILARNNDKKTNNLSSKLQGFLWCSEVTKASSCEWSLLHPSLQTSKTPRPTGWGNIPVVITSKDPRSWTIRGYELYENNRKQIQLEVKTFR